VIGGQKAYALNAYRFGSQGFGEKAKEYPVCIAFIYDGRQFTVSLYSETVDVSTIAKSFGGGGHKGAAGFVCKELPFIASEQQ
jgi:nanoRNase/pAp phosphatase (c-di-AMP/oligoRNAs hydrolase)